MHIMMWTTSFHSAPAEDCLKGVGQKLYLILPSSIVHAPSPEL